MKALRLQYNLFVWLYRLGSNWVSTAEAGFGAMNDARFHRFVSVAAQGFDLQQRLRSDEHASHKRAGSRAGPSPAGNDRNRNGGCRPRVYRD